jgi:hypothetical protein
MVAGDGEKMQRFVPIKDWIKDFGVIDTVHFLKLSSLLLRAVVRISAAHMHGSSRRPDSLKAQQPWRTDLREQAP